MSKRRLRRLSGPLGSRQSSQRQQELEAKIPGGAVTPELRQHADIQTHGVATDSMGFTTVARQKSVDKFERLELDGTLTKAEAQAARQLRIYADAAFSGMTGAWQMRVDGGSRPGESIVSKLHYVTQAQRALEALSSELRKVAVAWVLELPVRGIEGHTFLALGQSLFINLKDQERVRIAGKALAVITCRELAIHFRFEDAYTFDVAAGASGMRPARTRYMRTETSGEAVDGQTQTSPTRATQD